MLLIVWQSQGLKKGAAVQLSNGMVAAVTDMDDEFITLDANHQLAGKDLTFEASRRGLACVCIAGPANAVALCSTAHLSIRPSLLRLNN